MKGTMRFAIKKSWLPALITAWLGILLFLPGDALTELLALSQVLALTVGLVFLLSRVTGMAGWPQPKQRLVSWCLAGGVTAFVCLEPLLLFSLKR